MVEVGGSQYGSTTRRHVCNFTLLVIFFSSEAGELHTSRVKGVAVGNVMIGKHVIGVMEWAWYE